MGDSPYLFTLAVTILSDLELKGIRGGCVQVRLESEPARSLDKCPCIEGSSVLASSENPITKCVAASCAGPYSSVCREPLSALVTMTAISSLLRFQRNQLSPAKTIDSTILLPTNLLKRLPTQRHHSPLPPVFAGQEHVWHSALHTLYPHSSVNHSLLPPVLRGRNMSGIPPTLFRSAGLTYTLC